MALLTEKATLRLNSEFQAVAPGESSFLSSRAIQITASRAISVIALNKATGSCGG